MLSYHRLRKAQQREDEHPSQVRRALGAWSSWAPSIKAAAGFSSSAALAARSSALEARFSPTPETEFLQGTKAKRQAISTSWWQPRKSGWIVAIPEQSRTLLDENRISSWRKQMNNFNKRTAVGQHFLSLRPWCGGPGCFPH